MANQNGFIPDFIPAFTIFVKNIVFPFMPHFLIGMLEWFGALFAKAYAKCEEWEVKLKMSWGAYFNLSIQRVLAVLGFLGIGQVMQKVYVVLKRLCVFIANVQWLQGLIRAVAWYVMVWKLFIHMLFLPAKKAWAVRRFYGVMLLLTFCTYCFTAFMLDNAKMFENWIPFYFFDYMHQAIIWFITLLTAPFSFILVGPYILVTRRVEAGAWLYKYGFIAFRMLWTVISDIFSHRLWELIMHIWEAGVFFVVQILAPTIKIVLLLSQAGFCIIFSAVSAIVVAMTGVIASINICIGFVFEIVSTRSIYFFESILARF